VKLTDIYTERLSRNTDGVEFECEYVLARADYLRDIEENREPKDEWRISFALEFQAFGAKRNDTLVGRYPRVPGKPEGGQPKT